LIQINAATANAVLYGQRRGIICRFGQFPGNEAQSFGAHFAVPFATIVANMSRNR
jgi:hypothetical protein